MYRLVTSAFVYLCNMIVLYRCQQHSQESQLQVVFSDEEFSTSGAGSTDSSSISDSVSLTLSPTFSLISSEDSTCVV